MKLRTPLAALAAVMTLSAAGAAFAQDPGAGGPGGGAGGRRQGGPGGGRRGNPMMTALRNLNLTADQQAKVREITQKFQEEQRAAMQAGGERPDFAAMQARQQKLRTDIEAVLTPEQKTQFLAEIAKAQAAPLMARLEPLNLTDEQKAKIEPIVVATAQDMQKLTQDASLQPRDRREKQTAILDGMKAKVRPILTADQQTKFDGIEWNMRGGRGGGQRGGGANGGGASTR